LLLRLLLLQRLRSHSNPIRRSKKPSFKKQGASRTKCVKRATALTARRTPAIATWSVCQEYTSRQLTKQSVVRAMPLMVLGKSR
jgi:hypothetical protein